jgi:hypothetical protein
MKQYGIALAAMFWWPNCADAEDIVGVKSYFGVVEAVASGFYGHTGVQLAPGVTCRGQSQVLLLSNHPKYNEIFAMLMTAQATRVSVKFYELYKQQDAYGFCTIGEAALGNFIAWPR